MGKLHIALLSLFLIDCVTAVPEISALCPYTEYCTTGPQASTMRNDSCCRSCSCSGLCGLVGACCPDKVIANTTYSLYPCRSQANIYNKYLGTNLFKSNKYRFRIVTECHVHVLHTADTLSADMEEHISRCSKPKRMRDLVFVTSIESGITYLNKHCAICNDEIEFREWTLYTRKPPNFETTATLEDWENYVLANGDVLSFPTTEDDLRLALCFDKTIDICNTSNTWDVYNKTVEDKCARYDNLYFSSQYRDRLQTYKNVFCYICNMPSTTNVEHNCENIVKQTEFSYANVIDKGSSLKSFIALIVFSENEDAPIRSSTSTDNTCGELEIADPFHGRCIRLLCPHGSIPSNGKCSLIFDDISGFSIVITLNIDMDKTVDKTPQGLRILLEEILHQVMVFVDNNKVDCLKCQAYIGSTPNDTYNFVTVFKSSLSCPLTHIIERIKNMFEHAPFPVYTHTYNTAINLTGISDPSYDIHEQKKIAKTPVRSFCWPTTRYTDLTIHCPSVDLFEPDIEKINIHPRLKKYLIMKSTNIGNATVRVCLSDYKEIFALASNLSDQLAMLHGKYMYLGLLVIMSFV